jgi:hypothetical protein
MASPSVTQVTRRRQRSTRVSVAIGLIVLAALAVAGAALSGSWLLTTAAGGLAVLLGAVATRIVHSELVDSRVVAARDRAAQAHSFNELADVRSTEHASQVTELQAQIAEKEEALDQLAGALSSAQSRAAGSLRKHNAEVRRSAGLELSMNDAESRAQASGLRVAELEHEVVALRAELDTVTAAWHAAENARRHA